uniref:Pancreatic trypsin inhibitor n=1 Tax=Rhipicephalus zambeziensis TaxID=60191 RepID=A0A224YD53_9ACAR
MKFLLASIVLCLFLSLPLTHADDEDGEESETPDSTNDNTTEGKSKAPTKESEGEKSGSVKSKTGGEGGSSDSAATGSSGGGEEGEGAGEEKGGADEKKSKGGETAAPTKKPAPPEGESNGSLNGTAPTKSASPEVKGKRNLGKRCKSTIPNGNCVPNSGMTMWYFVDGTCTPKHVGGCNLKRTEKGYLLCRRCVQRCMGLKLTDKKINKICGQKA